MPTFSPLPSVRGPSPPEVRDQHIRRRQPVIIDGLVEQWTDLGGWTLERIKAAYGPTPVTVERQPSRDPAEHWRKRQNVRTTLGEFTDELAAGKQGHYLNLWNMDQVF